MPIEKCTAEFSWSATERRRQMVHSRRRSPWRADRRAAFVITSAERRAREAKVAFRSHVVVGHMIDHVLDFVNEHQIDLLVVAFRAPSNALSLFLTNRTERLIRLAPCD